MCSKVSILYSVSQLNGHVAADCDVDSVHNDGYTPWVKKPDPYDILARLHQKAQMLVIFDRDNILQFISSSAFESNTLNAAENHLQFP